MTKIEQWMKDAAAEILRRLKYGLAWESEIAGIIASHAPEAAAQPAQSIQEHDFGGEGEYGYCDQAKTAPHIRRKGCVNWTPEIEHNDH